MRIVIFNWRDIGHPKAGGAEIATHILARGLARRGHRVTWFTSRHPNSRPVESRDGYRIVRQGSEITCRFRGFVWLRRNRKRVDVVVDEVNTLPFLSRFAKPGHVVLWMHQLAREVWLAEAPPLIGRLGYLAEPFLMKLYQDMPIITISQSSAASFAEFGLRGPISVAEISLLPPILDATANATAGRIGYVGRVTPSKRIGDIIKALAIVKHSVPMAQLFIVGCGPPGELRRLRAVASAQHVASDVFFAGRLDEGKRDGLMSSFYVLAMTSLREGWGLVVSEAARYGVPSVVYSVPGLVDSVQHLQTGLIAKSATPECLASEILTLMNDEPLRNELGRNAQRYLRQFDDSRFVGRVEAVLSRRSLDRAD